MNVDLNQLKVQSISHIPFDKETLNREATIFTYKMERKTEDDFTQVFEDTKRRLGIIK